MSRLFKGEADGLPYFENSDKDYRSVYKSDVLSGLEQPGKPVTVDIVRTYKWSGTDWRPSEVSYKQRDALCKEIQELNHEG